MRMTEIDLTRHVRDAAYWGLPVGTPIVKGTKRAAALHAVKVQHAKASLKAEVAPAGHQPKPQTGPEKLLSDYLSRTDALPPHVAAFHQKQIGEAVGVSTSISPMTAMSRARLDEAANSSTANPKIRAAAQAEIARREKVQSRVFGTVNDALKSPAVKNAPTVEAKAEALSSEIKKRNGKLHTALSNFGQSLAKYAAKHVQKLNETHSDVVHEAIVRSAWVIGGIIAIGTVHDISVGMSVAETANELFSTFKDLPGVLYEHLQH